MQFGLLILESSFGKTVFLQGVEPGDYSIRSIMKNWSGKQAETPEVFFF